MLCDRVHFTERLGIAIGHEDRIIAEAAFAARGPDQRSLNTTFEQGVAANAENDVLVCRYFPAGNVWGENPLGR